MPRILDWQSVPWGVVSLTESEPDGEPSRSRDAGCGYARMRSARSDSFAPFAARLPAHPAGAIRLLGTSGTVTTLASLHLEPAATIAARSTG